MNEAITKSQFLTGARLRETFRHVTVFSIAALGIFCLLRFVREWDSAVVPKSSQHVSASSDYSASLSPSESAYLTLPAATATSPHGRRILVDLASASPASLDRILSLRPSSELPGLIDGLITDCSRQHPKLFFKLMNASEFFSSAAIKNPQRIQLAAFYDPRGGLEFIVGASDRLSDTERDKIVESASRSGFEAIGWILKDSSRGTLTVSDDVTRSLARLAHEFRPELVESLMATASPSEAQKLQAMLSDAKAIDTLLDGEAHSTVTVDAKLLADVFVRQARGSEGVSDLGFLHYLEPQTRARFLEMVQPQLFEAPSSLSTEAFVNGVIDSIAASDRQTFLESAVQGALEAHGNLLEAIGYCELMQEGDARTAASLRALSDWAAMDPSSASRYVNSIEDENVKSALIQGIERGETSDIHP